MWNAPADPATCVKGALTINAMTSLIHAGPRCREVRSGSGCPSQTKGTSRSQLLSTTSTSREIYVHVHMLLESRGTMMLATSSGKSYRMLITLRQSNHEWVSEQLGCTASGWDDAGPFEY
ncbi:hypothetical protein H4Q26_011704 [Puccinia striiformis f. sp. tritici PST-130]|uniref:Uncharacterized protein n=1 Tax=Puccinia striiformis f. sp. tritici PST-78 TaxID=1165861 RepID=A0A0L0VWE4_9BASI|nr:hypothetical protein H4Q26_011704 [Puccinia striiformis f. sp. tritici PST-130]KNF03591.1 hypothetical protein PSTG_03114 [Puccinia striiformis f. sp. tritici PST-78]